ncbi:histone-lysine N-methyltransferase SETMAR [Trichonephila clavipes]|nr:histone-lysine N-methyltransferase SETMAR [Trichonephila clavipes]
MSAMEPCGQLFTTCCDFGRCVPLGFLTSSPTSKRNCVGTSSATSVSVSGRPLFHEQDLHRVTLIELDKFKWETLDHLPYSSDMSPRDFYVLGPLKKHLKGKRFNSDDVLKDTVKDWVSSQPQEFWEQGIMWFVHQ